MPLGTCAIKPRLVLVLQSTLPKPKLSRVASHTVGVSGSQGRSWRCSTNNFDPPYLAIVCLISSKQVVRYLRAVELRQQAGERLRITASAGKTRDLRSRQAAPEVAQGFRDCWGASSGLEHLLASVLEPGNTGERHGLLVSFLCGLRRVCWGLVRWWRSVDVDRCSADGLHEPEADACDWLRCTKKRAGSMCLAWRSPVLYLLCVGCSFGVRVVLHSKRKRRPRHLRYQGGDGLVTVDSGVSALGSNGSWCLLSACTLHVHASVTEIRRQLDSIGCIDVSAASIHCHWPYQGCFWSSEGDGV